MNNKYMIVNGELYHYGIPGMKWGKRKGPKDDITQKRDKINKLLMPELKGERYETKDNVLQGKAIDRGANKPVRPKNATYINGNNSSNKGKLDPVITQKHVKNILTSVAVLAGTNATAAILKATGHKKIAKIVRKYGSIASGMTFASGLFNIGYTKATGGDKK